MHKRDALIPSPLAFMCGDGRLQPEPAGIACAGRHRVDLLLLDRLVAENRLSSQALVRAVEALELTRQENQHLLEELVRALGRLSAAGVRALPLKGPTLSLLLWDDLRLRRCGDVDLLVPESEVAAAVRALQDIGYRLPPPPGGLLREVHLTAETGHVLDLHWNIVPGEIPFPIDFDDIWAGRHHLRHADELLPIVGPEWLLVITAMYLVKDYPWPEAIYLSDLARLVARMPALDWARVQAIATRTGTRRICAVGLALLDGLPDAALPEPARRLFPADAAAKAGATRMRQAFAARRDDAYDCDDPMRRLGRMLAHGRFRERGRDRLHVYRSFLPLLLHPGRAYAGQGWVESSVGRLRRVARGAVRPMPVLPWRAPPAPRPRPGTVFLPLDDAGLVLSEARRELYALSPSGALVWCLVEEGMSQGAIARRLAALSGRRRRQARNDVAAALAAWQDLGLLGTDEAGSQPPPPGGGTAAVATVPFAPVVAALWPRRYRLLDTVFEVRFSTWRLAELADTGLAHLATAASPDVFVSVARDGEGFLLAIDGSVRDRCDAGEAVAPMVKGRLAVEAVNRQPFWLYLHAAMLRKNGAAMLLPAPPHSGKTCLSAALAKAGFEYCTDEITLLDPFTLAARGLPGALTVKTGAWDLLQPLYPELSSLRTHRRVDGWHLKYLPPPLPRGAPAPDTPTPVRAIVFPRFEAGTGAELGALPRADALCGLMAECLAVRMELTADHVRRLVRWAEGIACYSLRFGDLAAAVDLLGRLAAELDWTGYAMQQQQQQQQQRSVRGA